MSEAKPIASPAVNNADRKVDAVVIAVLILGFAGSTVLLALTNGTYFLGQLSTAAYVSTMAAFVLSVVTAVRRSRIALDLWQLGTIIALMALLIFESLSLGHSLSPVRGHGEVLRVLFGISVLAVSLLASRLVGPRAIILGLVSGGTLVCLLAFLSRFLPQLFPLEAHFEQLKTTRLAWPLGYWNGLGGFATAVFLLLLGRTIDHRNKEAWKSATAAAFLPIVCAVIFLTLSRSSLLVVSMGSILAIIMGGRQSWPLVVAGFPGLVLALLAASTVTEPVNDSSYALQLLIVLGSCALTFMLTQVAFKSSWRQRLRHSGPVLGRQRRWLYAAAGCLVVTLAVGSGVVGTAWKQFRVPTVGQSAELSTARLKSLSSNQRYQVWSKTINEIEESPFRGIGAGSFENRWNVIRDGGPYLRNAHSQGLEYAVEAGILAAAAFFVALLLPLIKGLATRSSEFALAGPAYLSFCLLVLIDWGWQLGAYQYLGLALGATLLGPARDIFGGVNGSRSSTWQRVILPITVLIMMAVVYKVGQPLRVEESKIAEARVLIRENKVGAAQGALVEAVKRVPYSPNALVELTELVRNNGDLVRAASLALTSTRREPANWRGWYQLAIIRTLQGKIASANQAIAKARDLNPSSPLLRPDAKWKQPIENQTARSDEQLNGLPSNQLNR